MGIYTKTYIFLTIKITIIDNHIYLPCGSDGKASACSAGDPGSIPGLGRSPGLVLGAALGITDKMEAQPPASSPHSTGTDLGLRS